MMLLKTFQLRKPGYEKPFSAPTSSQLRDFNDELKTGTGAIDKQNVLSCYQVFNALMH